MNKSYVGMNDEDKRLTARVEDALEASAKTYSARFIGFLDKHQQHVAQRALVCAGASAECLLWGGYPGAERVYLGLFAPGEQPDYDCYPIGALHFTWKFGTLTHRDFLGALLSLGLKIEKFGDIIVSGNECTVVLDSAILDFVASNLEKVGGTGVAVKPADLSAIAKSQSFQDITDTLASPRLDCVVSALLSLSRGQSAKLIQSGLISVDFEQAMNPAVQVNGGVTVSIRGHGRFVVDAIGPVTKKGRLRFLARKYL